MILQLEDLNKYCDPIECEEGRNLTNDQYVLDIARQNPDSRLSRIKIELEILRSKKYQVDMSYHLIRFMQLLWPDMTFHYWRVDMIRWFCFCMENGYKEYSIHGASNCQKSSTMAMLCVAFFIIDPEYSSIYVTSPYKDATDSGIWSNVIEYMEEAADSHKWVKYRIVKNKVCNINKKFPRGFIRIATSDKVGKLVGKKSKDVKKGILLLIMDEAPEFTDAAQGSMKKVLTNWKSVDNMFLFSAGNFASPDDLLGDVSKPKDKEYTDLDIDEDIAWLTNRAGICRRYDGEKSPNIVGDREYSGLTTLNYITLIANESGVESPEYLRFIRSFPVIGTDEFTITTLDRMKHGKCFDEPQWANYEKTYYGYCDPGWGSDPCKIQVAIKGKILKDGVAIDHVHFLAPINVKINKGDSVDDKDDAIVSACEDVAMRYSIDRRNFGYDSSLRGHIVRNFTRRNRDYVSIDNLGPATNRVYWSDDLAGEKITKTGADLFSNFNTEQHFAVAFCIDSSQLTGMSNCQEAKVNLTNRKWKWSGKKKILENKLIYKNRNSGKSPTGSDIMVGAFQMVLRSGFVYGMKFVRLSNKKGSISDYIRNLVEKKLHMAQTSVSSNRGKVGVAGRINSVRKAVSSRRLNTR